MSTGFFKSSTPTVLNVLILVLALAVLASFGVRTIGPGGWWTHLASGSSMAEEGGVPEADEFTFTNSGEEIVAPSWLYDKIVYRVWDFGGAAAITLLHIVVVVGAFLVMIPLARRWCDFPSIALSILLSAWLISFRYTPSPSIFVLIFPAVFLAMLYGNVRPVYLWTIIPLCQWLWTNMYGSFLLGPLLCMLMALQAVFPGDDTDRAIYAPRHYLGLSLLCLGVTSITPYGVALHRHIFDQWDNPPLLFVNEWISPFASQFHNVLPSALLVITLVIGAAGLITYRHKLPLMLTIVVALVAFLAVRSMRFIEVMAVLAFPFICLTMQATLSALGNVTGGILRRKQTNIEYFAAGLGVLVALFSFWSIFSNNYYCQTGSDLSLGLGKENSALPVQAATIIEHPDFPERALNLPLDGGYLAWRFPQRKIFVDTRTGLFSDQFYSQINKALWGDAEAWNEVVEKYSIDAVILPCAINGGGKMVANVRKHENWNLTYFDGTTAVFLRNNDEYSDLIDNRRIQQTGLQVLKSARKKYVRNLRGIGFPANSTRLVGAGNVFYSLGRMKRASALFDLLATGAPNMTAAWMYSGLARARMGDEYAEEAIPRLEKALELNPELPLVWCWLSRCYEIGGDREMALEAYENGIDLDEKMAKVFPRPGSMQ